MSNGLNRLLKESIKGPYTLDLRFMPIFMIIFFPIAILIEGETGFPHPDYKLRIISRALGLVALFSFYLGLSLWWSRSQKPALSLTFLLLFSGTGGVVELAVAVLTARYFGLRPEGSIFYYMVLGFFTKLMWLPINAFLVTSILGFRDQREDLLQRAESLRALSFRQNGLAQKVRKVVEDGVISELKWSRVTAQKRFQSSIQDNSALGIDPQLLKSYAGGELRSISHRLWSQARSQPVARVPSKKHSLEPIRELLRLGLRLPPIDVRVYCAIYAPGAISFLAKDSQSPIEFLNFAFLLICFYFLMAAGEKLYERFPQFSPQIFPLRIVVAVYLPFFLLLLLNPGADFWAVPRPISFLISSFLLVAIVVFIITISKAAAYSREQIILALNQATNSQKAQLNLAAIEIATISRQWAQYIHGNLQSRLLAAAAVLEGSVEGIDVGTNEAAIAEATRIMSGDFQTPHLVSRSFTEEVIFQIEHWQDLIEIELDCDFETNPDWLPIDQFGAVVEEVIANAFRHGHATKIAISIHLNNDGWLECNFTDNGIGGAGNQPAGLGSSIFDVIAKGNWSLKPGPDGIGTCLHMIIPALELLPARGGSSVG